MTESLLETESFAPRDLKRGRTAGIVSVLTLVVAFVGYLREATLASHFGLSAMMDAYFAAVFVPTLVYMVLIAGTLSPLFIPILIQDDHGEDRVRLSETFSVVTTFVLLLLVTTITAGMVTVRWWLPLLFSGFGPATISTTIRLVYIIFPAVLFVALAGILTAVQNGFQKFALAAFAPALSSITVIVAALLAHGDKAIYIVGFATAFGFILQFVFLLPATAFLGIRYTFTLNFWHPAVIRLLRLGIPLFLYLVVANASSFLERNLASHLSAGTVSTLTYAMRLFTIPANFLAAPMAIVAYPMFAREAVREERGDLCNQVSRIFRLVCLLFLPLTVWVVLNSLPLTRCFYERGQFHLQDSVATARVLILYGIGILPNAMAVVLLRCFYAAQDTITPLVAESIDLGFYIIAVTVLTKHFGIVGLALTRGLTFFVVAAVLIVVLRNQHGLLRIDLTFTRFFCRVSVATLVMAIVSWGTLHFLQSAFDSGKSPLRMAVMCIVSGTSGVTFLGMARLLGIEEAAYLFNTALGLLPGNRDGQWFSV